MILGLFFGLLLAALHFRVVDGAGYPDRLPYVVRQIRGIAL